MGQNTGRLPRLIHDTEGVVLLVSALYKCSNGHLIYSTDPRLMKKISIPYLPFILLHRTGFTRSFITNVGSLVQQGLSMNCIARHIKNVREQAASHIIINALRDYSLVSHQQCTNEEMQLLASTITSTLIEPLPTNDVIARCFLIDFQMSEAFYIKEMMGIKVRRCLRLDHTFKVASNIGYLRDDGKWITQYGSVFFVVNEDGQVVTWQLTNSTSFSEVTPLLCALHDRIDLPKDEMLTVYVDNCCHVKAKITEMFGSRTVVKLDIFHAVQRITKAMSKRHSLYHVCVNDLRMVFRSPTDMGKRRTMTTPDIPQLLLNLYQSGAMLNTMDIK